MIPDIRLVPFRSRSVTFGWGPSGTAGHSVGSCGLVLAQRLAHGLRKYQRIGSERFFLLVTRFLWV